MFLTPRITSRWRHTATSLLPWIFVLGVAAWVMWTGDPARRWWNNTRPASPTVAESTVPDEIWQRWGNTTSRHPVEVLHTIDGDTFQARVHVWPGMQILTRVRLRGIDAPEMKANCAQERQQAEAATDALRRYLSEGGIVIFNIGPDKYSGRIVADVGSARTANISSALLSTGLVRAYDGGRRQGWCDRY